MAGPVAEVASVRRDVPARGGEQASILVTLVTQLDWLLFGGIATLLGFGLWALSGITRYDVTGDHGYFVRRQAIYAAVGVPLALAVIAVGPAFLQRIWRYAYAGTIVMLAAVLAPGVGQNVNHATRWISVGSFQFQPSEFAKPLLAVALAGFLAERGRRLGDPRTVVMALVLAGLPIVLVFMQPDLGTALVYAAIVAGAIFLAGAPWTQVLALVLAAIALTTAVLWAIPALTGHQVLHGYQRQRLIGWTNPSSDPTNQTYNIRQSKIAVASGGVRGLGVSDATQTRFNFLPAHRTDFAFAAFAEQHGFVGAAALLLLYLLVLWRGLRVVALATDAFSAIMAGGIVCMFLFQIAINAGMTMQIAPVTGIPLPLLSYGGSAMIANLVALGLLLSIQVRVGRRRRV